MGRGLRYQIKIILNKIFDYKIYILDNINKNSHTNKSAPNTLYRLQMKVDEGVSTWRSRGLYVQYLKKLTFAKSKSTGNNWLLTTIASRHEPLPATQIINTREYIILNIKNKN